MKQMTSAQEEKLKKRRTRVLDEWDINKLIPEELKNELEEELHIDLSEIPLEVQSAIDWEAKIIQQIFKLGIMKNKAELKIDSVKQEVLEYYMNDHPKVLNASQLKIAMDSDPDIAIEELNFKNIGCKLKFYEHILSAMYEKMKGIGSINSWNSYTRGNN